MPTCVMQGPINVSEIAHCTTQDVILARADVHLHHAEPHQRKRDIVLHPYADVSPPCHLSTLLLQRENDLAIKSKLSRTWSVRSKVTNPVH